jgi:hypothetical protein
MNANLLNAAAEALDALAAGETPKGLTVVAGAMALDDLCRAKPERDLLDAADGLKALAAGRPLVLNDKGRTRAAYLAGLIRNYAAEVSTPGSSSG